MQSIVRHIETNTQIKLERETRIGQQFTREYLKYRDNERYEEQKSKDQERKRLAKERKEKETAEALSMDQNQESTSTPSSAFKHKRTKSCSLKKADKAT